MLYLRVVSDFHLEFSYDLYDSVTELSKDELTKLIPPLSADEKTVLIVAGDLATARYPQRIRTFLEIVQPRFKHIIYVLGNHEHYGSCMSQSLNQINGCLQDSTLDMKKITLAGNDPMKMKIGDVTFICGTLWTDYDLGSTDSADIMLFKHEQYAREASYRSHGQLVDADFLKKFMADFEKLSDIEALRLIISRFITDHRRMLGEDSLGVPPAEVAKVFHNTVAEFGKWLEDQDNSKTVVITHHLPSFQAVAPQYMTDPTTRMLNHAFASDLDAFILKHQPAYWFFGHTHIKYSGKIGKTDLWCNPLGYPNEPTAASGTYDSTKVFSL